MTREQKLEAIYKEMANKNFTLWCKIKVKYRAYYHNETGGEVSYAKEENLIVWPHLIAENWEMGVSVSDMINADKNWYIEDIETLVEIIGHPVMIGDVLDWIEPYWVGGAQDVSLSNERKRKISLLLFMWEKKREAIEFQPDGCIDYIYDLIWEKPMG